MTPDPRADELAEVRKLFRTWLEYTGYGSPTAQDSFIAGWDHALAHLASKRQEQPPANVWHEIQCASFTGGSCNCRPRDVHAECRDQAAAHAEEIANLTRALERWKMEAYDRGYQP